MDFFRRARLNPKRLGIFPGTFNPVTIAHLALARAALHHVDEVVFVLPRVFPHKNYSGASFEDRIAMLEAAVDGPAFSVASSDGGLFFEIARECRASYSPGVGLWFLCGRDAAERIAGWDYGRPKAFAEMLEEFGLLVAARAGCYSPSEEHATSVQCLDVEGTDSVSATDVRQRAARGDVWEHLVPAGARPIARGIYPHGLF